MQKFSDAAIEELRLWALSRGPGHARRTCPDCSADRKQRHVQCLSAEVDSEKVLAHCWHCGSEGAVRLHREIKRSFTPAPKKPQGAVREIETSLDALGKTYLKGRGISEETAKLFGVTVGTAYFPDLKRETHALAMPFWVDGKVSGHKLRSTEEKAHVCKPALYSLFGQQLIDLDASQDIIITEGELDALSLREAGVLNAVSVPNGAQSFSRNEQEDSAKATYAFLWPAKAEIDRAKRILIATDADENGNKLADELARRIGKHRCWRTKWPEGYKDANEVLMRSGEAVIRSSVENSEPWPVSGLYEADQFYPELIELYRNGFGEKVSTGMAPLDEIYSLGKGLLTVVTGIPAHGKSTLVDTLMLNSARIHGWSHAVCSFENPPHVHIAKLAEILLHKDFLGDGRMSEEQMAETLPFINRHFKFLYSDDGKKAELASIIERIKTAVFRWGVRGAVIDPYNYIARPKKVDNETQWIDDMLTELKLMAQVHDLHLWFIAHPTKLQMNADGSYPPPRGFSISGSAAWYSKPDFGLTVYKEPDTPGAVRFINWKTRWHWLGREDEVNTLYDTATHNYITDAIGDLPPYVPEEEIR